MGTVAHGRPSSRYAERVSHDLRRNRSADMSRRRGAIGLSLFATAALGVVEAYQTGLIGSVPEPPLPGLDADRVDASGEAYYLLGTPDAALGIASAAVTMVLLGTGTADRATTKPALVLLTTAKAAGDALAGAYLFLEQIRRHRRVCSWCTGAAAAQAATFALLVPEARRAWRSRRRR